jgi:hypothetical protein
MGVTATRCRSRADQVPLHRPRWALLVSLYVAVGFAALITLTSAATAGSACIATGTGGCTMLRDCCQAPAGTCQSGTCCSLNGGGPAGSCTDPSDCCSINAACTDSKCCLPTGDPLHADSGCCQAPQAAARRLLLGQRRQLRRALYRCQRLPRQTRSAPAAVLPPDRRPRLHASECCQAPAGSWGGGKCCSTTAAAPPALVRCQRLLRGKRGVLRQQKCCIRQATGCTLVWVLSAPAGKRVAARCSVTAGPATRTDASDCCAPNAECSAAVLHPDR